MVDDGLEHTVFGIFHHRRHAFIQVIVEPGAQLAIQRVPFFDFIRTRHINIETGLRLLNQAIGLGDIKFHILHVSHAPCGTRMNDV
ncbi:hypothetical protein D3C75_739670 [compost metagenome]